MALPSAASRWPGHRRPIGHRHVRHGRNIARACGYRKKPPCRQPDRWAVLCGAAFRCYLLPQAALLDVQLLQPPQPLLAKRLHACHQPPGNFRSVRAHMTQPTHNCVGALHLEGMAGAYRCRRLRCAPALVCSCLATFARLDQVPPYPPRPVPCAPGPASAGKHSLQHP